MHDGTPCFPGKRNVCINGKCEVCETEYIRILLVGKECVTIGNSRNYCTRYDCRLDWGGHSPCGRIHFLSSVFFSMLVVTTFSIQALKKTNAVSVVGMEQRVRRSSPLLTREQG